MLYMCKITTVAVLVLLTSQVATADHEDSNEEKENVDGLQTVSQTVDDGQQTVPLGKKTKCNVYVYITINYIRFP